MLVFYYNLHMAFVISAHILNAIAIYFSVEINKHPCLLIIFFNSQTISAPVASENTHYLKEIRESFCFGHAFWEFLCKLSQGR